MSFSVLPGKVTCHPDMTRISKTLNSQKSQNLNSRDLHEVWIVFSLKLPFSGFDVLPDSTTDVCIKGT